MAGLSVLLEGRKEVSRAPQIISKSFVLRPFSPRPSPPTSGFLEACFLCGKQLSLEKDIYMYRGDKAFCSVECRCRQIFMDEEETVRRENCSLAASPIRQGKRIARGGRPTAAAGGFVY